MERYDCRKIFVPCRWYETLCGECRQLRFCVSGFFYIPYGRRSQPCIREYAVRRRQDRGNSRQRHRDSLFPDRSSGKRACRGDRPEQRARRTTTILSVSVGTPLRYLCRTTATTSTARRIKYSSETVSRTTAHVVTTNLTGGGSRRIHWRMNTLTIPNIVSVGIIRFL